MNDLEITINGLEKFLQRSLSSRMVLRIFYKSKTLFEIDTLKYASVWLKNYSQETLNSNGFDGEESFVLYCTNDEMHYHYSLLRNITQGLHKFIPLNERYDGKRITSYAYFFETPASANVFLDFLISVIDEKYSKVDSRKINFQVFEFDTL